MDFPRLYIPSSSINRIKTWSAEAIRNVEGIPTAFDQLAIESVCLAARRAERRFIACEDYELNELFEAPNNATTALRLSAEYEFQAPLSALAHMYSEDSDVLMLFAVYLLSYGDPGFIRMMQIHLRHSLDAVHLAMVGCEFIQRVSGVNYLLELDNLCPRIILPHTVERFVADATSRPVSPRTYSANYLKLPEDERRVTSPWAMMKAVLDQ